MFSCQIYDIFKNTFVYKTSAVAASAFLLLHFYQFIETIHWEKKVTSHVPKQTKLTQVHGEENKKTIQP